VRSFHSFIWASGGLYSDFYIHIIDHLCWMKNAWPVKAMGLGGRHYKTNASGGSYVDQNFDVYGVEYTYPDGSKLMFDGRCMTGCSEIYSSFVHGSKGIAVASKSGDCGAPSSIYRGQDPDSAHLLWESKVPSGEGNPYKNEWMDLITAIRNDQPYNEAKRGAEASVVTSMGRFAAHTGKVTTYQQMLENTPELAPEVNEFTMTSDAPLKADSNGKYPIPQPGKVTDREY
jgi:predicted dehydrogenase